MALAGASVLGLAVHFGVDLPRCPWKVLFGLPCPTCGSTRVMLAFLEGAPGKALHMNPLIAVGTLVAAAVIVYGLAAGLFDWPRLRLGRVRSPRLLGLGMALALAINWVFLWRTGI